MATTSNKKVLLLVGDDGKEVAYTCDERGYLTKYEENNVPKTEEVEVDHCYAEGEGHEHAKIAMVLRRVLQAQDMEMDEQREAIFQTRWIVNSMLCDILMDGRFEANCVSLDLV